MYLYLICWLHSPALLHTLTPRTDIYIGYSSRDGLGRCGDDVGWGETIHLWLSFSSRSLLIHFSFDASSSYSLAWTQPLMDAFLRIHWSGIHHQSLQNPPPSLFEACGRVFPIRPIQLLRSMLNYRSSRESFPSHCFRGDDFLCANGILTLSLSLFIIINKCSSIPGYLFCTFSCWSLKPNHQFNRCSTCSFVIFLSFFSRQWWTFERTNQQ